MKPTSKSGREDSGRGRALLFSAILSASIIFLDQLVKAEIVASIPENKIGLRLMNDFLWIVHTRNLGIAFSIGDEVSRLIRSILFILVPAVFIVGAILYSAKSRSLSFVQRIAIACIVGGGAGNLIDRIFRPEGVVDFISFSLFGFLGLERFPTFNVADLSISIGAGLLLLSGFLIKDKEEPGHDQGN
ncbi:MAG: signal peptidase II [Spirochaetia bacterium]|jgi:signal peptidase II|uniref:Lipoprotein signal peptidase n=1 Tax=bioreactor metagenome TaxID=1076179 RepID=A0A644TC79_9ZZZZ|nr:signal peptidase II [Spirochaetia bacterium]MCE1210256.1 signal peptidase II [Spirochaetia bacterium]NLX45530.1 signal peptidase II [Treponema sp.]VBB38521.1 Lipoprotein signal peptidase [uncultured Spirochaetota bacterium]HOI21812.1 signal peptidase II [Spirochaetales bacterium]